MIQPARAYEREKTVIDDIFFETIVFEEFKRPSYVDELDWTSRTTVRSPLRRSFSLRLTFDC